MAKRKAPTYGPLTSELMRLAQRFRASGHAAVIHLQAGGRDSYTVHRTPGQVHVRLHKGRKQKRWKRVVMFHIDNGP
jgi:hypothetical protein